MTIEINHFYYIIASERDSISCNN